MQALGIQHSCACTFFFPGTSVGGLESCKCLGLSDCGKVKFGELSAVTTPAVFVQSESLYIAAAVDMSSLVMMRG